MHVPNFQCELKVFVLTMSLAFFELKMSTVSEEPEELILNWHLNVEKTHSLF